MRWVNATVLVRLFQDSPSQFAHLRIAMRSGSDRLPRRTGLCVLFHAYQLLIICVGPWTMVDHEVDQLDLVAGVEKLEMVVPLGSVSV